MQAATNKRNSGIKLTRIKRYLLLTFDESMAKLISPESFDRNTASRIDISVYADDHAQCAAQLDWFQVCTKSMISMLFFRYIRAILD